MFLAHSGRSDDGSDGQPLLDHLADVSRLASTLGAPLGLAKAAEIAGLGHDLGKYDPRFQAYLRKRGTSVDHSTAGGAMLRKQAVTTQERLAAETLAYCILGHHAGLPDRSNETTACLNARIDAFAEGRLDPAWRGEIAFDLDGVCAELLGHVASGTREFDLSVAVRMVFSCLVEADFLDTEAFYARVEGWEADRSWPALRDRLPDLRARFDAYMAGLRTEGDLNPLRRSILDHVRSHAGCPPGLFTLTVPTGGGKTLASLGFALDHAAAHARRRIIYAIPFTSIIDQTAAIFRDGLGEGVVLEHHSAIDAERDREGRGPDDRNRKRGPEGKDKLRLAMENWAAPVVVTTNVQLFESLFAARPSRARKLHNIAGSVIVLDEAQTLPRRLLRPCVRMLDCLARHWGCSVVFCTATQPSVQEALRGEITLDLRELAPDPKGLDRRLRRARLVDGGEMDNTALVAALRRAPQGFVIVNGRKHALDLFEEAKRAGLDGLVHLTTRQTAAHRHEILKEVRRRLDSEVGESCRLIATSLIEAGVDVSFPRGWRAKAGLDQMIQAAGRVNREGRWPLKDSALTFFASPEYAMPPEIRSLIGDTERMWEAHEHDPQSPGAVEAYFAQVYARLRQSGRSGRDGLDREGVVAAFGWTPVSGTDFAFRTVAEAFRMIESTMLPVIIPRGAAAAIVERLGTPGVPSGALARDLQRHVVLTPERARQRLVACGKAEFVAPGLRGDQFCVLKPEHLDLYHDDSGLWWEDAEYLGVEQWTI